MVVPTITEIVAVGTEILLGEIENTNAGYLSRMLAPLGMDVFHHGVVGDNLPRLTSAVTQALDRADLVITCGGLGPTADDLTRDGVALALGLPLEEDPLARQVVEGYFRRRGVEMKVQNSRQWMLPRGALALDNPCGSAPGFLVEGAGRVVISLPGPPGELIPMVESQVVPYLRRLPGRDGMSIVSRVLRLTGIGESAAEALVEDIIAAQGNPTVAPYAKPGEVRFRITAKAAGEEAASALIAPVEKALAERLAPYLFGVNDENLEAVVGGRLAERCLTLAVAESCTGGLIGHRLTNVPGSSAYFLLGALTYSNEAKAAVLGVPRETLSQHGAVSAQTALAMAEGVRRMAGADIGLATTGIAGPGGGTPQKPVGTLFMGLSTPVGNWYRQRQLAGEREAIKAWSAQEALGFLWSYLDCPGSPGNEGGR